MNTTVSWSEITAEYLNYCIPASEEKRIELDNYLQRKERMTMATASFFEFTKSYMLFGTIAVVIVINFMVWIGFQKFPRTLIWIQFTV